jgi:cyclic nucleotide-binding protein
VEGKEGRRVNPHPQIASMARAARRRRRLLAVAQVSILLAAIITFAAAQSPGPFRFGLYLTIAQPAILIGVLLYVSIMVSEFVQSHGILRMHFNPGEPIFQQGEAGDSMYAVIDGQVEVVREEADGKSTILGRLGAGQYFGEMALVSEAPRMATVRALTAVEVAVMGRVEFAALYAYLPDFHRGIDELMRNRKPQ